MAKNKKNGKDSELDAILDQLKKSYENDSSDENEKNAKEEDSVEDVELSEILGKIFLDDTKEDTKIADDEEAEKEHVSDEDEGCAAENSVDEEPLAKTEEETPTLVVEEVVEETVESIDVDENDLDEIVVADLLGGAQIDEPEVVELDVNSDFIDELEADEIGDEAEEAIDILSLTEEIDDDDDFDDETGVAEFAVEDEEYEQHIVGDTFSPEEVDEFKEAESGDAVVSEEPEVSARLILDPAEYTLDSLQNTLQGFNTKSSQEAYKFTETEAANNNDSGLDKNDISLLLKFGYDEEVVTKIGEENAQKVIFEKDNTFTPESYQEPFGFCGKEFSDREQITEIKTNTGPIKKF